MPHRVRPARVHPLQGSRAHAAPWIPLLRHRGYPRARQGWRIHRSDLRYPPGNRQSPGRLLPEIRRRGLQAGDQGPAPVL